MKKIIGKIKTEDMVQRYLPSKLFFQLTQTAIAVVRANATPTIINIILSSIISPFIPRRYQ